MGRKGAVFVLALFYLLQATWLLHAGADFLFPRLREAVASKDSCCVNRCGCPEEVQARKACCCAPGSVAAAPKKQGPVSSIEEAKCRGVESAMMQALTQPTLCGFASLEPAVARIDRIDPRSSTPGDISPAVALEKVPIA